MGVPGCPDFACCTASIESVRMVLIHSWSISVWVNGDATTGLMLSPCRFVDLSFSDSISCPGLTALTQAELLHLNACQPSTVHFPFMQWTRLPKRELHSPAVAAMFLTAEAFVGLKHHSKGAGFMLRPFYASSL